MNGGLKTNNDLRGKLLGSKQYGEWILASSISVILHFILFGIFYLIAGRTVVSNITLLPLQKNFITHVIMVDTIPMLPLSMNSNNKNSVSTTINISNKKREKKDSLDEEVISLDSPPEPLKDYIKEIKAKINANWSFPKRAIKEGYEGRVTILFLIDYSGTLKDISVVHSSGYKILDTAALHAISMAQPFEPFPPEFTASILKISADFNYKIAHISSSSSRGLPSTSLK